MNEFKRRNQSKEEIDNLDDLNTQEQIEKKRSSRNKWKQKEKGKQKPCWGNGGGGRCGH